MRRGDRARGRLSAAAGSLCVLSLACNTWVYPSESAAVRVEDLASLISCEEPDIASGALLVAGLSRRELRSRPALESINELAAVLRRRLRYGAETREFARTLTSLLLEERCFRCVDSDALGASDLALVLERKEGNCLGLSVLFLSLAQKLGAPFWGVSCPEHYFVRFDDGKIRFNVELTMSGRELPDRYYKRWKNIWGQARVRGTYLVNDSSRDTLAVLLASRAGSHLVRGEHEKATELAGLSLKLRPDWPQAHINRALAHEMRGEMEKAERGYLKALELDPNSASAMNNLASLYLRLGRKLARARELALRAVELRPRRREFRRTAADILKRLGHDRAAEKHLKAAGDLRR